jgi:hypothetical protein
MKERAAPEVVPGGTTPSSQAPSNAGALRILATGSCELRFEGTLASQQARVELKRNIAALHERIVAGGCATMIVDVQGLQFVDSSSIRIFVDWIACASEAKYKIVFLIDPTMTWQRLNFSALKSMATDAVEVREMGVSPASQSEPNA